MKYADGDRANQLQDLMAKSWFTKLGSSIMVFLLMAAPTASQESRLTLQALVDPSTVFFQDGQMVRFAVHGFVQFQNLEGLFAYIDLQAGRWQFTAPKDREDFASDLLYRGMQSRMISMEYEKPLEILQTHTARELSAAVGELRTRFEPFIYKGAHWQLTSDQYRSNFLKLQQHWKTSLNCWSASPSIPARVLSNWYLIDEGIDLFGARYDSTEHFWQAVKYHPETRLTNLLELLDLLNNGPWAQLLDRLSLNQAVYLEHTYAVEFLRANLQPQQRERFRKEVAQLAAAGDRSVRELQQRDAANPGNIRFSALQEKILWGDLADVFHLLYFFGGRHSELLDFAGLKPLMEALRTHHFDGIYLDGYRSGKVEFISSDFRQLMLEIWKVKYLEMERFGEVLRSTQGLYLDHFLNDGDSPDIPIPVYVGFLNQIREIALNRKP